MRALRAVVVSIAMGAGLVSCKPKAPAPAPATTGTEQVVWLPYAPGLRSYCAQGAFDKFTHGEIHAWDFMLAEGRPVVAAAGGRVIRVIDHREQSGRNVFDETNQVFIDHGGGIFATYLHHRAGTARVDPGEIIAAGTHLADVGNSGTMQPHIHFDVRGPSWHQTHAVRFRVAGGALVDVQQGGKYDSATPAGESPPVDFADSTLRGDEFAANGVKLQADPAVMIFRIRAGATVTYRGELPAHADHVYFYLWQDSNPSEYGANAPARGRRFELQVRVPATSRGERWYRITTTDSQGNLLNIATLPVLVE